MFLFLSLCVAVGMPLASRWLERRATSEPDDRPSGREKRPAGPSRGCSLASLWEVEDVRQGLICLAGGRYAAIASLGGIDFALLSEEEQRSVESSLMAAAYGLGFPVQFLTVSRLVDARSHAQRLFSLAAGLAEGMREYSRRMAEHLASLGGENPASTRRSYAVVWCRAEGEEEARREIHERMSQLSASLSRARVSVELLGSAGVVDLLHWLLNRGSWASPSELVSAGALDFCVSGRGVMVDDVEEAEKAGARAAGARA